MLFLSKQSKNCAKRAYTEWAVLRTSPILLYYIPIYTDCKEKKRRKITVFEKIVPRQTTCEFYDFAASRQSSRRSSICP